MSLDVREVVARIANGGPVRASGGSYMVKCPGHDDGTASLNISPGTTQPVVLHCHAGCEPDAVLEAVGLSWDMISTDQPEREAPIRGEWTPRGPAIAVYDYRDEAGHVLSQVLRTADKQFPQRVPDASRPSGFRWSLGTVRRVLYRLPEVIECVANGAEIWITEGEKDANSMVTAGVCGTCPIGGAGKWRDVYGEPLRDASVTIVADNDEQGRKHARQVRASLLDLGVQRARIVEAVVGKDATDHLRAGKTLDEFLVTVPYEAEQKVDRAPELDEYLDQVLPDQKFVIEGTLARGEVLMVTGYEGFGKSTFMKQVAVQVAFGVHPFTGAAMPASRVLFIDAENKLADNHADFARLRWIAGHHATGEREALYVLETRPFNLGDEDALAWFLERVRAHKPDLLVCGPIYNMVARDLKGEDDARSLKAAIDAAQAIDGCAVMMEHHVPHGNQDGRDLRPIGSSLLLRWPSFGFGLDPIRRPDKRPTGIALWSAWRGGRRRGRNWPEGLRHGTGGVEWMWEPADPQDIEQARAGQK